MLIGILNEETSRENEDRLLEVDILPRLGEYVLYVIEGNPDSDQNDDEIIDGYVKHIEFNMVKRFRGAIETTINVVLEHR